MEQALYQAAISTFEELCFVFPTEGKDMRDIVIGESSSVVINFKGELEGELVLTIEDDALASIAENMLGEDDVVDHEMIHDVLGELANVICGNVLPEIAGAHHIFKLSAPSSQVEQHVMREPKAAARLTMDEGRADVSLFLK